MKKKKSKRKEVYVYDDTKKKEITVPKLLLLTSPCGKQKKQNVCVPLSHIHIVVEFRSSAGGRTCLCSLCMAQTGASQPRPDSQEEEEEERRRRRRRRGGGGGGGSGLAL